MKKIICSSMLIALSLNVLCQCKLKTEKDPFDGTHHTGEFLKFS